jgi:hypothetical protein
VIQWEPTVTVSREDLLRERQLISLAPYAGNRNVAITFDAMMTCWGVGLDPKGVVNLCLPLAYRTHQIRAATGLLLKVVVEKDGDGMSVYTIMLPHED